MKNKCSVTLTNVSSANLHLVYRYLVFLCCIFSEQCVCVCANLPPYLSHSLKAFFFFNSVSNAPPTPPPHPTQPDPLSSSYKVKNTDCDWLSSSVPQKKEYWLSMARARPPSLSSASAPSSCLRGPSLSRSSHSSGPLAAPPPPPTASTSVTRSCGGVGGGGRPGGRGGGGGWGGLRGLLVMSGTRTDRPREEDREIERK